MTTIRGMCAGWVRYRRGDEPLLNPKNGVRVADTWDGPLDKTLIMQAERIAAFDLFTGLVLILGEPIDPEAILPRFTTTPTLIVVADDSECSSLMDWVESVRGPYFTVEQAAQFTRARADLESRASLRQQSA